MDGGLLSLKWNNHRSTLFYMLSTVRKKECYTDVTLACDGKFYSVHKLVLSMCSEYFEQMFEQTQCKHPVIVLKDIKSEELESLLSYMYVGEVNVVQEKLSGLIKAAECLKIKGLAVPDEEPCSKPSTNREKRSSDNSLNSEPKRRRQDDSGNTSSFRQGHSNNRNDDRRKSLDHPSSSTSNKFRNTNSSNSNVNSNRASSGDKESGDRGSSRAERVASPEVKTEEQADAAETEPVEEVMIDEPPQPVKEEPTDADAVYLSDSNSVPDHKDDILMDNFADAGQQQHFMDELLGQTSESNQGNMGAGDYSEGGEGSSGAGGQQQQHMVDRSFSAGTHVPSNCLAIQWNEDYMDFGKTSPDLMDPFQQVGLQTCKSAQDDDDDDSLPPDVVPVDQLDYNSLLTQHKKYRCPVCDKLTNNKYSLRRHYMLHTGEKPYKCQYCSFRGSRTDDLKNHIDRSHRK